MKKIILVTLFLTSINLAFSQVTNGGIPNPTKRETNTTTNSGEDDFYYESVSRLNIGFGNNNTPGVSTFGLGYMGDFALSKTGRGNLELELGTTSLITTIDIAGFSESSSAYIISGALKYGYFVTDDIKFSAGGGYYVGLSGGGANDIYYSGTIDYFFSKSFGLNVRYDELLGFNFGISFIL